MIPTGQVTKVHVAVLLPGFAINWQQNQVTRQPHLHDLGWGLLSQFSLFCYFPNFSKLSKHLVIYITAYSYLTGVTAAELLRHLTNINVISGFWPTHFNKSKFPVTEKSTNRTLVTPPLTHITISLQNADSQTNHPPWSHRLCTWTGVCGRRGNNNFMTLSHSNWHSYSINKNASYLTATS